MVRQSWHRELSLVGEKLVFGRGVFLLKAAALSFLFGRGISFVKKRALISQGSSDLQSAIETLSRNKGD